jgi:hypothetical protein
MTGQKQQSRAGKGIATGIVTATLLAACGSSHPAATGSPTLAAASHAPATSTQAASTPALIAKFKAAGLPVTSTYVFTAANDPNHLLGRPNGYVAKVAWTDSRINASDLGVDNSAGSVDLGGSIEQYSGSGDAKSRMKYIQSIEKAMPMVGTEYDYVVGTFLVRVSSQLTPTQADAYEKAAS